MADRNLDELPPHDRRRFFGAGLSRVVGALSYAVEKGLRIELPLVRTTLRPPGALPEKQFLDTCFRCGSCAEACPADAISLTQDTGSKTHGTPYVQPSVQACVICDELACMKACPSGALKLVGRLEIRMGLAHVDHETCVRSQGENCVECIDRCPIARTAIRLNDAGRIEVIDPERTGDGCTGCGLCEQVCPTAPKKAIRILPYA